MPYNYGKDKVLLAILMIKMHSKDFFNYLIHLECFPLLSTDHNYLHFYIYCLGYREINLFGLILIFHHGHLYLCKVMSSIIVQLC